MTDDEHKAAMQYAATVALGDSGATFADGFHFGWLARGTYERGPDVAPDAPAEAATPAGADAVRLAIALGSTVESEMRRALESIATLSHLSTASPQEIARSALRAADEMRRQIQATRAAHSMRIKTVAEFDMAGTLDRLNAAGAMLYARVDHIGCANCARSPDRLCPSCREAVAAWELAGGNVE